MLRELKPCPFCGGEAHITIYHNEQCTWVRYRVCCRRCDARSGKHKTAALAERAWNGRTESEELKFTREFIREHGLEFALASAWKRRAADV